MSADNANRQQPGKRAHWSDRDRRALSRRRAETIAHHRRTLADAAAASSTLRVFDAVSAATAIDHVDDNGNLAQWTGYAKLFRRANVSRPTGYRALARLGELGVLQPVDAFTDRDGYRHTRVGGARVLSVVVPIEIQLAHELRSRPRLAAAVDPAALSRKRRRRPRDHRSDEAAKGLNPETPNPPKGLIAETPSIRNNLEETEPTRDTPSLAARPARRSAVVNDCGEATVGQPASAATRAAALATLAAALKQSPRRSAADKPKDPRATRGQVSADSPASIGLDASGDVDGPIG